MAITPAVIPAQYNTTLVKQGAFDADIENQINALAAANDVMVALVNTTAIGFAAFNSAAAVTLLPATAPAGTYLANLYAVLTTAFATNTNWVITLGYTDDYQAQTNALVSSSTLTIGTYVSASCTFRSNGTAAVTYTPSKTGSSATTGVVALTLAIQRIA